MKNSRKNPPKSDSPFLNVEEAASYLRISPRALENFRCAGGGPLYRKHGHKIVYHINALEDWSKGREFPDTGGGPR